LETKHPSPRWPFSSLPIMKTQEKSDFQQPIYKKKNLNVRPFPGGIELDPIEAKRFKTQMINQASRRKSLDLLRFPAFFRRKETGNPRARKADG